MKLSNIMFGSEDSKKLADFYEKIFGKAVWVDDENGWYAFDLDGAGLVMGPHSEVKGKNKEPARVMFGIESADVKADFDRIKSLGAEVIAEPYQPAEDVWMATFADPDGNYFQLASPWK